MDNARPAILLLVGRIMSAPSPEVLTLSLRETSAALSRGSTWAWRHAAELGAVAGRVPIQNLGAFGIIPSRDLIAKAKPLSWFVAAGTHRRTKARRGRPRNPRHLSPAATMLTVEQAAERLQLGRRTVIRLVADKTLASTKIGGARRIPLASLLKLEGAS